VASWFPFAVRQTSAQATAPSAAAWAAADWRQKAVWALPYYSAQGVATWHSWKREPERTWKRRCFDVAHRAMVRVSVTETLFKAIDTDASSIQIHHCAAEFPADVVAHKLHTLLRAAPAHHRLRMLLTGATVPFALVFLTALPGPNVVLYWAAYRTYAHYTAWQGARHLAALLARGDETVTFVDAPHLATDAMSQSDISKAEVLLKHYATLQRAEFDLALEQASNKQNKKINVNV
jgi:hypothetical protein